MTRGGTFRKGILEVARFAGAFNQISDFKIESIFKGFVFHNLSYLALIRTPKPVAAGKECLDYHNLPVDSSKNLFTHNIFRIYYPK